MYVPASFTPKPPANGPAASPGRKVKVSEPAIVVELRSRLAQRSSSSSSMSNGKPLSAVGEQILRAQPPSAPKAASTKSASVKLPQLDLTKLPSSSSSSQKLPVISESQAQVHRASQQQQRSPASVVSFRSDWAKNGNFLVLDVEAPETVHHHPEYCPVDPWVVALITTRDKGSSSSSVRRPVLYSRHQLKMTTDPRARKQSSEDREKEAAFHQWQEMQMRSQLPRRKIDSAGHFGRLVGALTDRSGATGPSSYEHDYVNFGLQWGWKDSAYHRRTDKNMEKLIASSRLLGTSRVSPPVSPRH